MRITYERSPLTINFRECLKPGWPRSQGTCQANQFQGKITISSSFLLIILVHRTILGRWISAIQQTIPVKATDNIDQKRKMLLKVILLSPLHRIQTLPPFLATFDLKMDKSNMFGEICQVPHPNQNFNFSSYSLFL